MKSQRRHELQQNVLDAELAKSVAFLKTHGPRILWTVLIVLIVVSAIIWYTNSRRRQRWEVETRYSDLKRQQTQGTVESPDLLVADFKGLTQQNRVPRLAALACVDVGDILAAGIPEQKTQADRDAQAKQADRYYRMAITDYPEEPLAQAKAHFGLAKMAEGRRDFDVAGKEYRAVLAMADDLTGQPVVDLARGSLDAVKELAEPIRMATTAPAAETQPAETAQPEGAAE